jgi:hypothetical protein
MVSTQPIGKRGPIACWSETGAVSRMPATPATTRRRPLASFDSASQRRSAVEGGWARIPALTLRHGNGRPAVRDLPETQPIQPCDPACVQLSTGAAV